MSTESESWYASKDLETVFRETDDPVLTAVEVADELGVTQQAAHSKLSKAHENGEVERKKTGARSVVWWVPDYSFDPR